jgi:hypothetical protein
LAHFVRLARDPVQKKMAASPMEKTVETVEQFAVAPTLLKQGANENRATSVIAC